MVEPSVRIPRVSDDATQPAIRPIRLVVTGTDDGSCAAKIVNAVRRVDGMEDVSIPAGTVTIRHHAEVTAARLAARVTGLGFGVADTMVDTASGRGERPNAPAFQGDDPAWWRGTRGGLTLACGGSVTAAYITGQAYPAIAPYAYLAAMAVGLVPIAWRALVAARLGTPFSTEMIVAIAAVGAVFIGAAEEAASVVFLFLVVELLEGVAASRARNSIRGLTDLAPRTALVEEVPAETFTVGSTVMIRPVDRIPADGTVSEGAGEVDEAPVTGESVPRGCYEPAAS